MSRAAADEPSRKRGGDGAHEGAPASRRRRLLAPSNSATVRSFALSSALIASTCIPRKRRHSDASSSARLRRRRDRRLCPSQFSPVRPFGLRVMLATGTHSRRKRRVVDVCHPISTPLRRRRHSSIISRVRHFPVLRPFALRFLFAASASAPRRRRKPALIDIGNYISLLLKSSNDGLEVHRGQVQVEREVEANKGGVIRSLGDCSVPAFELLTPPEKRSPHYEEALKEFPDVLACKPDMDLSGLFKPLTDKDEIDVNAVLHDNGHRDKIIVTHGPSNIEITKEKFQCLRFRGWLNDEVINLYIELLKERAEREPRRFLKCHFFNTFFYKKLTCGIAGYDYQSVRRWTAFKKLGYGLIDCEKIFVPVHREVHWCLAVINMKDKTFQYLDSLGGTGHDVLRIMARYIMDELKDKSNIEIDISSWVEVSDSVPLQQNGWDCGMFMLKFIDFLSRGLKPFFSQEHMAYFRKRTAKEIMRLRAD